MKVIILVSALFALAAGRAGVGPGEQDWGYVTVRPGAHMFYWLYYHSQTTSQPLVIWLQGGPGASSTGYGNFEELGIVDTELNVRNNSWVNHVNVLFIDNPVGTGFSYVDSSNLYTTTNVEIAVDLVSFMREFLKVHPEFKTVPLYIFSESYGGKMAAEFALALHQGMVDTDGYKAIDEYAQRTKAALDAGEFYEATNLWGDTEMVIDAVTGGIDFYNILYEMSSYRKHMTQIGITFKIVISVELLLEETDLTVCVFTGQLDLIVDTPGTLLWAERMQWSGSQNWLNAERTPLTVNGIIQGYKKTYGNFYFYWLLRSGHMVPTDNPHGALKMLQEITNYTK
ncbi:Retinoid-inducible serine carboxypeptidase [Blattella germanica]|nr:Retinoid-inducible serine carboxypeptidase [Blattella germanica]